MPNTSLGASASTFGYFDQLNCLGGKFWAGLSFLRLFETEWTGNSGPLADPRYLDLIAFLATGPVRQSPLLRVSTQLRWHTVPDATIRMVFGA